MIFDHITIYVMEHIIRSPPTKGKKKEHWVVERGTRAIITISFLFNCGVGDQIFNSTSEVIGALSIELCSNLQFLKAL